MTLKGPIEAALQTTLSVSAVTTLATGGVHNTAVPEGTATPYVVYSASGGSPGHTFNARLHRPLYLVRAIVKSQWPKVANDIYATFDVLLDNKRLTIVGGTCIKVQQESEFSMSQDVGGGVVFQHVGAYYRIEVDEAG